MKLSELVKQLQEIEQEHGGDMKVILDTNLVVAPLENIRVADSETVVLEV